MTDERPMMPWKGIEKRRLGVKTARNVHRFCRKFEIWGSRIFRGDIAKIPRLPVLTASMTHDFHQMKTKKKTETQPLFLIQILQPGRSVYMVATGMITTRAKIILFHRI